MAKKGLRALSMEKSIQRPRAWLEGLRTTHPDHPGLWVSFSLSRCPWTPPYPFAEDLALKLAFLDTGVLDPPIQKGQP